MDTKALRNERSSTSLQGMIQQLQDEAHECRIRADRLDNLVIELRSMCSHEMQDDGVDQRGRLHFKCSFCGKEEEATA